MDLKQILFDGLSKEFERNANAFMDKTIKEAENKGLQVSFKGIYKQSTKIKGSSEMPVPFVVAQTLEQITKLKKGVFEGKIYDVGRYATINGTINPEAVEFNKRYESTSIPKGAKKVLLGLRDILEPKHKGKPLLNPSIIKYQGHSEDKGQIYTGTWTFNYKPSDMATKGTFIMQRKD